MKNFLITGYGRSGTKFLANLMNSSSSWTVLHEPRGDFDQVAYRQNPDFVPERIINDFNRDFYGEVNSRLRFYFDKLDVEKKGIVLRNSKNILVSVANRREKYQKEAMHLNRSWKMLHRYLHKNEGILRIEFEKMTTDVSYLRNILQVFGINDVEVTSEMIGKKVNENRVVRYRSFDELPPDLIDEYESLDWSE